MQWIGSAFQLNIVRLHVPSTTAHLSQNSFSSTIAVVLCSSFFGLVSVEKQIGDIVSVRRIRVVGEILGCVVFQRSILLSTINRIIKLLGMRIRTRHKIQRTDQEEKRIDGTG